MKKIIVALFIALALSFVLVSCSNPKGDDSIKTKITENTDDSGWSPLV